MPEPVTEPIKNTSENIIQVALPVPLRKVFDYLPANGQQPVPGCRVQVPFGNRKLVGLVVAVDKKSTIAREKLKIILQVLDQGPLIEPAPLKFLQYGKLLLQKAVIRVQPASFRHQ